MYFNVQEYWEYLLVSLAIIWLIVFFYVVCLARADITSMRIKYLVLRTHIIIFFATAILQTGVSAGLYLVDMEFNVYLYLFALVGIHVYPVEPYLSIISASILTIIIVVLSDALTCLWRNRSIFALLLTTFSSAIALFVCYNDNFCRVFFDEANQKAMTHYIKTMQGFRLADSAVFEDSIGAYYHPIDSEIKSELFYFLENGDYKNNPENSSWYFRDDRGNFHFFSYPGFDPKTGNKLLELTDAVMDELKVSFADQGLWSLKEIASARERIATRKLDEQKALLEKQRQDEIARQKAIEEEEKRKEAERLAAIERQKQLLLIGKVSKNWLHNNTTNKLVSSSEIIGSTWFGFVDSYKIEVDYFSNYEGIVIIGFVVQSLKDFADLTAFYNKSVEKTFQLYDNHGKQYYPRVVTYEYKKTKLGLGESFHMIAIFDRVTNLNDLSNASFSIFGDATRATLLTH